MTAKQQICTPRLTLQPFAERDLPALKRLLTNEDIKRSFMLPDFADDAALSAMAEKLLQGSLSDAHFLRGIYLGDTLVGFINDVEMTHGSVELGYVIHPEHQQQGFATEALRAAIDELLTRGFTQVVTGAFDSNHASIRVMQKCGMVRLDKTDDIAYRGQTHHCVYFAARA